MNSKTQYIDCQSLYLKSNFIFLLSLKLIIFGFKFINMKKLSKQTEAYIRMAAVFYEETGMMEGYLKFMRHVVYNEVEWQTLPEETKNTVQVTRYVRKDNPRSLRFVQHQEIARKAFQFDPKALVKRSDLVQRLKYLYDAGTNKIEQKNGFLNHLFRLNLIEKTHERGIYKSTEEAWREYPKTEEELLKLGSIEISDKVEQNNQL